jgi:hypothetical protein
VIRGKLGRIDGQLAKVEGLELDPSLEPRFAAHQCSVSSAASCAAVAEKLPEGKSRTTNAMRVASRRMISCTPGSSYRPLALSPRAEGKHVGRSPRTKPITDHRLWDRILAGLEGGHLTRAEAAKRLRVRLPSHRVDPTPGGSSR